MKRPIIAITGLNGSGKSTVAQYLVDTYQFKHVSFRGFLKELLIQRGEVANREAMRVLANELRATHGADHLLSLMLNDALQSDAPGVIIESIRTVNEVTYLKGQGAVLVAVTAPALLRYERIFTRGSETDQISFEEFIEAERKESESTDGNIQNLPRVGALADFEVENSKSIEAFHESLSQLLDKLIKNHSDE